MRIIRSADYRVMPWKNGGGTTTEIVVFPDDAGLSGRPFAWRVSIADVARDGPFSRFPGYDRHIMVIAGKGMILDTAEAGELDLRQVYQPVSFSGDWDVAGRLCDGPVRDFNLMVSRARGSAALDCRPVSGKTTLAAKGETLLAHCLDGEFTASGHVIAAGDSLILTGHETIDLSPLGGHAVLAVCSIRHHGQGRRI